jgi:hypothetical protein
MPKMSIADTRYKFLREIEKFCESNKLNFAKVMDSPQSCSENMLAVQHWDESVGANGLLDETPAEIILLAKKTGETIVVEKCENTDKYLAL